MKKVLALVLLTIVGGISTQCVRQNIELKQNCTGYLGRASDANSVETAEKELSRAIKYLEEKGLTKGYTSVFYQTPDEDIEFWYNNLKSAQKELIKVSNSQSSLERSNVLIKLRETLLDNGSKGEHLTVPDGLSRYPNNGLWAVLSLINVCIILGLFFWGNFEFSEL